MKNHIVSQMIIKRFAPAINVFDFETGRIDLAKKPHKVFYKDNLLPEDLDHLLSIWQTTGPQFNCFDSRGTIPSKTIHDDG